MQDINLHPRVINFHSLPNRKGIYVTAIEKSSPAEIAGLQEGDVIVAFSEKEVNSGDELFKLLNKDRIGIRSPLTVIRKNSLLVNLTIFPAAKAA